MKERLKLITMKGIFILIKILLISLNAMAWQAPKPVTDAFQQKFNEATNVKWLKENDTDYEASFDLLGKKMTAIFNEQGQWLSTETEVGVKALPGISRIVLQTRFIGWQIATAHKIDKADGSLHYRADLDKKGTRKEVFLKKNGTIIK